MKNYWRISVQYDLYLERSALARRRSWMESHLAKVYPYWYKR